MSREHVALEISARRREVVVEDLHSANGTFLVGPEQCRRAQPGVRYSLESRSLRLGALPVTLTLRTAGSPSVTQARCQRGSEKP